MEDMKRSKLVFFKRERGTRPANNIESQTAPPFHLDVIIQPLETTDADCTAENSLMEAIRNAVIEDVARFGGSSDPVIYTLSRVRRNC